MNLRVRLFSSDQEYRNRRRRDTDRHRPARSRLDVVDCAVDLSAAGLFASHETGTARMGTDPRTSVVKSTHEAHEVPGLFVADPSAFPLPPSVDPSLGIMAWSYVAAEGVKAHLG